MSPRSIAVHAVLLVGAIACWLLAVDATDLDGIAGLGLLNVLPATWYLALALLTVGFAIAVTGETAHRRLALGYVVVLIFVLHGTTALLYEEPRYAWTYKHLGVIDLIAQAGQQPRDLDIYANWPSFFALNAWFARASGLRPLDYAAWAQVFFELCNVAALLFVFRGLTSNARISLTAVWLFLVGNWIGQDYLSPQAFAFVVSLVLIGLYLRSAPPAHQGTTGWGHWLDRTQLRLAGRLIPDGVAHRGPRPASPPPEIPARLALALGTVCFVAIVITHQLTPIVLIISAFALAIIVRRIPLWVPIGMAVIEGLWLLPARPYLSRSYDLFNFNPFDRPKPVGADPDLALSGVSWVGHGAQLTVLLVTLLAIAGLVRRLRRGYWDIELVVLIVAPILLLPLQSYGGEGPLRMFLFALPWLAFLGAHAVQPRAGSVAWHRPLRLIAASAVVSACFLFAYFGLEKINRIGSDDVAAAEWVERNAPPGTLVTYLSPNFPFRTTGGYARLKLLTSPSSPNLLNDGDVEGRLWGPAEVQTLSDLQSGYDAPAHYVVVSPSQEDYMTLYGMVKPGSVPRLTAALRASPQYRLVHRDGEALVFEWLG